MPPPLPHLKYGPAWTKSISGTISVARRQIHVRLYTSADLFMSFLMPLKSRKILNEPAFELLLYKANSFHFAIVCLVIDAQKTSERGKCISDTLDSVTRIGHILPRYDDICASHVRYSKTVQLVESVLLPTAA